MSPDLAVAQYLPLAQKLALRFYASKAGRRIGDADDCLQVALLGLTRAALKWIDDGRSKFITYAWVVILNQLRHAGQEMHARRFADFLHDRRALERAPGREREPADVVADFSAIDALDSLEDPDRLVLRMRHVEGVNQKETARRLKMDWWVVQKIERRGLDALRKMLAA